MENNELDFEMKGKQDRTGQRQYVSELFFSWKDDVRADPFPSSSWTFAKKLSFIKNKNLLTRLLHIIIALLLLISTTGFTISSHRCGGHLVSVAILGEATNCYGGTTQMAVCKRTEQTAFDCKKGCCQDSKDYFKADIDEQQTVFSYQVKLPQIAFVQRNFLPLLMPASTRVSTIFPPFPPPDINRNIAVFFQIFRL